MADESSGAGPVEKIYADPAIQAVHSVGWDALKQALVVEFEAVSPSGRVHQRYLSLQIPAAEDLRYLLEQALADTGSAEPPRQ